MHLPLSPPDLPALLLQMSPDRLRAVLGPTGGQFPLVNGNYLHWDELRHRPPPEGWSHEDWWLRIKQARQPQYKALPLQDKAGRPFVITVPEPAQIALHHIDRDAAGQIASEGLIHGEQRDRYLMHSLIEEAITSSQLEGASTTRRVAEGMLREGRLPRDTSERMIFNNFRAMEAIREMRNEPITPQRILELHHTVTLGVLEHPADAGRLRQDDTISVRDRRDNTLLHQPPVWRELPERLERLCAFANQPEHASPYVHPVLRAILLHFMIGYDHPFSDGNGRTARALFYWAMARSGYWLMEFLSISHFLRKAPARYVRSYLHSETDDNDTTYFALHQLHTIGQAIGSLHQYLARTTLEQRQTERLLAGSAALRGRLNHRQVALLNHALRHPGEDYRVDRHQRTHGVVYQTARSDLLALEALGLLTKYKAGNAYQFSAVPELQKRIEDLAGGSARPIPG